MSHRIVLLAAVVWSLSAGAVPLTSHELLTEKRAVALAMSGHAAEAAKTYQVVVDQHRNDDRVLFNQGAFFEAAQEAAKAAALFEEALKLSPSGPNAERVRARLDRVKALAKSSRPVEPAALSAATRGQMLLAVRDIEGAASAFREANQADQAWAGGWANLAIIATLEERHSEAVRLLTKAVALERSRKRRTELEQRLSLATAARDLDASKREFHVTVREEDFGVNLAFNIVAKDSRGLLERCVGLSVGHDCWLRVAEGPSALQVSGEGVPLRTVPVTLSALTPKYELRLSSGGFVALLVGGLTALAVGFALTGVGLAFTLDRNSIGPPILIGGLAGVLVGAVALPLSGAAQGYALVPVP